eukprot:1047105-Amphidinium_carterae.1
MKALTESALYGGANDMGMESAIYEVLHGCKQHFGDLVRAVGLERLAAAQNERVTNRDPRNQQSA